MTYSLKEDADEALKKITSLDGRKIFLSYANQKPKKGKKSEQKIKDNDGKIKIMKYVLYKVLEFCTLTENLIGCRM